LAVQALMHVFRRNTRVLTLLTGDLDFKPLVEALVQEGAYVTLAYEKRTTARELIYAADMQHVLWPHDLVSYQSSAPRASHRRVLADARRAQRRSADKPACKGRVRDHPRTPHQDWGAHHRTRCAHPHPVADELPAGCPVPHRCARHHAGR